MSNYLFDDINTTKNMVEGAYKKLKSYIYYDKTMVYIKKRISELESSFDNLDIVLEKISNALVNKDDSYFEELISLIDFNVVIKSMTSKDKSANQEQEDRIVRGNTDHDKAVRKLNFFIDMPIELFIVDCLWTLLLGKLAKDSDLDFSHAYATVFKTSLYNSDPSLISGIDFQSNRMFEPYFGLYTNWRNSAFNVIKKTHKDNNLILMCLDLRSFYYSVCFDFANINSYLNNDGRLESFVFLTSVIEKIYRQYTDVLSPYKKGIYKKATSSIFPIGVLSALVLRELYLNKFDKTISNSLNPQYYGRYVDDILLVLPVETDCEISQPKLIEKYLINTQLVSRQNNKELFWADYEYIRVQTEKINIFYFSKKEPLVFLDIYNETLKLNSSEANLMPDVDMINESFQQNAYNIKNFELSNKIRDLGLLQNNNYNATRYINVLQRLTKNTDVDKHEMTKHLDQIGEFYRGSAVLEFSNNWRTIFEQFIMCKEKSRILTFFSHVKNMIDSLDFNYLEDELLERNKKRILRKLKNHMKIKLDIAYSLALSLDYSFSNKQRLLQMARAFRKSNMLNHNLISYPLLNYTSREDSMLEKDIGIILARKGYSLDQLMLKWSPRYIKAHEFYIANFLHNLAQKREIVIDPNKVEQKYQQHNNLLFNQDSILFNTDTVLNNELICLQLENNKSKDVKVALLNTKITEVQAFKVINKSHFGLTWDFRKRISKIINEAIENNVSYLVFPEFFFPFIWLPDIADYAVRNGINIITGLQYITVNNEVHNFVCNIVVTSHKRNFNKGIILFREKNYYAPKEISGIYKRGYVCKDSDRPQYYIIKKGDCCYSTVLCYEFTDIEIRAALKSNVDILFVPQLNRDTNYFSAIVDSASRDLHCFIAQANTSEYGDSRITAPYSTAEKNIIQVKGGETDVIMMTSLDLHKLKKSRLTYAQNMEKIMKFCPSCSRRKKNLSSFICDKCRYMVPIKTIKFPPPNFKTH